MASFEVNLESARQLASLIFLRRSTVGPLPADQSDITIPYQSLLSAVGSGLYVRERAFREDEDAEQLNERLEHFGLIIAELTKAMIWSKKVALTAHVLITAHRCAILEVKISVRVLLESIMAGVTPGLIALAEEAVQRYESRSSLILAEAVSKLHQLTVHINRRFSELNLPSEDVAVVDLESEDEDDED